MKFLLLAAGLLLLAPDARAQVVINKAALDQLAGIAPVVAPAVRQPARIAYRRARPRRIASAPRLVARPAAPVKAPPHVQPLAPPAPRILPATIRFTAGAANLPGDGAAILHPFCRHSGMITIDAHAAADPADPSGAARLSMSRAFAIRDALTACGVPSASIIPRADGAGHGPDADTAEVLPSP